MTRDRHGDLKLGAGYPRFSLYAELLPMAGQQLSLTLERARKEATA